jgi:hypothetical protein
MLTAQWLARANALVAYRERYLRTNVERERHDAEKALDRHVIPDLARVVGKYLCDYDL